MIIITSVIKNRVASLKSKLPNNDIQVNDNTLQYQLLRHEVLIMFLPSQYNPIP